MHLLDDFLDETFLEDLEAEEEAVYGASDSEGNAASGWKRVVGGRCYVANLTQKPVLVR